MVSVYDVPPCNPVMVVDVAGALNVFVIVVPLVGTALIVYVSTIPLGGVNEIFMDVSLISLELKLVGGANDVSYEMDEDETELPSEFIAIILIVYVLPPCNPVIIYDVAGALNVCVTVVPLVGTAVTLYWSIVPTGGGVNEYVIVVTVLAVPIKFVGADNNVLRTIDVDVTEFSYEFVAIILRVYDIPPCNPVIVVDVAGALNVFVIVVPVVGTALIVYVSITPIGGVNEIFMDVSLISLEFKLVGADNIVAYEIDVDDTELPFAFVAIILIVYGIPRCNPLIVADVSSALILVVIVLPVCGTEVIVY
jgi:uncharacterized UPF0146 family protein